MAEKDTVTKDYMQDKDHFADAFNFLLYDGEQIIKPEELEQRDTTSIVLPYGEDNRSVPIQKYRDVLKKATIMEDDKATYLLLGIENQSEIHYAMPVRNMLYDALQYANQVDNLTKSNKKSNKRLETSAEFLSGLSKTDKLWPVITLTLYFGADKWTAPRDLHSMLLADKSILRFIDNYHLHLIAPAELNDEDFEKFRTELGYVLEFIKNSNDDKKLEDVINKNPAYKSISSKTANLINVVTNSNLQFNSGEERINMCEAIKKIREESFETGIEIGTKQGMNKGVIIGSLRILKGLVEDGTLSVADAAKRVNMSVSDFKLKTGLKD